MHSRSSCYHPFTRFNIKVSFEYSECVKVIGVLVGLWNFDMSNDFVMCSWYIRNKHGVHTGFPISAVLCVSHMGDICPGYRQLLFETICLVDVKYRSEFISVSLTLEKYCPVFKIKTDSVQYTYIFITETLWTQDGRILCNDRRHVVIQWEVGGNRWPTRTHYTSQSHSQRWAFPSRLSS